MSKRINICDIGGQGGREGKGAGKRGGEGKFRV